MPIYEYRCPGCDSKFERRLKFSEMNEAQSCPACGSEAERQLSVTAPLPVAAGVAASCPTTGKPCHCGGWADA
ncbi:MAG: zinc ribbon domain-containing protein [Gemmatimonadetes bacterium]|nr:zinc ribbon domain-containing protein [Gemmatimonadota bacterium]